MLALLTVRGLVGGFVVALAGGLLTFATADIRE